MSRLLIALIRFYQYAVSPLLGPRCRYTPSCSQYALEAIGRHGPLPGELIGREHPRRIGGEGAPRDVVGLRHGGSLGIGHGGQCSTDGRQPGNTRANPRVRAVGGR